MHAIAYVLLYLVVVADVAIVVLAIVRAPGRTDLGVSDDDGGGGGPGERPCSRPQGPRGSSDPPWWPEFERDFAAYVAREPGASNTPGTR